MAVFSVGDVAIHRVEELRIPNSIAHFTRDEALVAAHRHWLQPHFLDADDRFDLVFQSWIFVCDGRVVLVDPCTGNGKPHAVPFFDNLDIPYIERMQASGFRPQDVDFVVCTHLHHDHCGWNTHLRDGRWVPTFPKARYVIQQAEFARWRDDRMPQTVYVDNRGVFEQSVRPIVDAGLAELVSGDRALTANLRVEFAPGHTVGHQMLSFVSADRHALFTGDAFHHPIQLVDPGNPFGEPENPEQIAALRVSLAERSADTGALLIPAHLPAPHAVQALRRDGRLEFRAAGAV